MTAAPRILLVDDDLALLQALPHMIALRIHGVIVDISDTAQHALAQIQEHDYDTIVTDITMPGMDGLELLAKIHELRPDIPTMLITGHADQDLMTQAIRGGAYDFIQKPIDRIYFVAALHRAIQTRQLRRQVREQQRSLEAHTQSLELLVEKRTRELLAANEAIEMLVRDLLDVSLIETDRLVLHPTVCNLVEICQQVLDAYAFGAGLALSFEAAEKSIEVEVDYERISQVLITLLFHARKNSPKGSPIKITLEQTELNAVLTICDMGAIDESIPWILEHFYSSSERAYQAELRRGKGLGIYLSQRIIEQHGGSITIQNGEDRGEVFSITLPLILQPAARKLDETSEKREVAPFRPPEWLIS